MRRRIDAPALAVAAGLAALAAALAHDAAGLTIAATYGVGPKAAPYAIALLLVLLALGHAGVALRPAPPREPVDAGPALSIAAGLAGLIVLLALGAGFAPAVAALFAATAAAFGRRAPLVDLALGLALGLLVYLLFAKGLSLTLPAGPLERLL